MASIHENEAGDGGLGAQISEICVRLLNRARIKPGPSSGDSLALNRWLSYQLLELGLPHVMAVGHVKVGSDRTPPGDAEHSQHTWIELANGDFIDVTLRRLLVPEFGESHSELETTWEELVIHRKHPDYMKLPRHEHRRLAITQHASGTANGSRHLPTSLTWEALSQRD